MQSQLKTQKRSPAQDRNTSKTKNVYNMHQAQGSK